jgi:Xaa-Pro aminopeptidase
MQNLSTRMSAARARPHHDAARANTRGNGVYLSGAWLTTQKAIPDRLAIVVWPRAGEPQLIVCTIEESLARRDSRLPNLHGYVEFVTSPIEQLAAVLQQLGLTHARIGFERKYLVAHYYDELKERLPNAHWGSADALFDEVRMIKNEDEIAQLSRAAQAVDSTIWEAFQQARAGRTEKEIADWMQMQFLARGASEGIFLVLGAGDTAGLAHPSPRQRALQNGEVLRVDCGGVFNGYLADLARSMVVGRATQEQRDNYARLWQAQQETIAALRPGVRACDVFRLCERRARELGLDFNMPHIGHSLGIGLHEHPMISPRNEALIEENMAIAIEPTCRNRDGSIFHIEDLIIVRANSPEIVSRAGQWERLYEGL